MKTIYLIVLGLVFIGAAFDLSIKKIPNIISLLILTLGIGSNTFFPGGLGLMGSFYGLFAGFILMFFFYLFTSMGAGDVKLMSALGSLVGYQTIIFIAVSSIVISGFFAVIYLILKKDILKFCKRIAMFLFGLLKGANNYQKPDASDTASLRMPMAPAIALSIGYMMYVVCK